MTAKKKVKKKRGRGPKYIPEFCELAERACMLGAINADLARKFGVHLATIKRWMKKYPDFRASIIKGRETADEEVAISLYKRATGYSHPDVHISSYMGQVTITPIIKHYPPDTAAAFIWLKNRRPDLWRDKTDTKGDDLDPATPVAVNINVKDCSKPKEPVNGS